MKNPPDSAGYIIVTISSTLLPLLKVLQKNPPLEKGDLGGFLLGRNQHHIAISIKSPQPPFFKGG
jgi:hypothetical protein